MKNVFRYSSIIFIQLSAQDQDAALTIENWCFKFKKSNNPKTVSV
jgi:hypothetical protein